MTLLNALLALEEALVVAGCDDTHYQMMCELDDLISQLWAVVG